MTDKIILQPGDYFWTKDIKDVAWFTDLLNRFTLDQEPRWGLRERYLIVTDDLHLEWRHNEPPGCHVSVGQVLNAPEVYLDNPLHKEASMTFSTAQWYLEQARAEMADRASQRDSEEGERSMSAAVRAFNEIYGHSLTETEGWQFMSILKKVRGAQGAYREDDYTDDVAYAALAAEAAAKEESR